MDLFLGCKYEENPYNYKTHFLQFLENENKLDILFLKFEDIDQNPGRALEDIIKHLEMDISFTLSSEEVEKIVAVTKEEETETITWGKLAQSIGTNNFNAFFDTDITTLFDSELKVDWRLIKSGTV